MTARNYSNTGSDAEAAVLIGAADTSAALANYSGFPAAPYIAALDPDTADEEIVLVTNVIGSTVTITRAYDGTTAKSHAAGATFRHVASALDFQEANDHVNATAAVHGVAGALVGTSDTQTLSNKTLTSPSIASPTVTGTMTAASAAFSGTVTLTTSTVTDLTATTAAVTGTLTVGGVSTLAAVNAQAISGTTGTFSGAVTVGGTLGVTGALTGSSGAFSGALSGLTGTFTTTTTDEVELEQQAADPSATAASHSSLYAKTDSGLHFRPQGQNTRRVSMHWGSGTTLPTTGALSGDTFYDTNLSSLLRYNGSNWRQVDGPVEIANMAARPSGGNLHAGFQVFSLSDDETYTYDGTFWRNGLSGSFTPTGAGAGDYITGIVGSTQGAADSSGNLACGLLHTFSSANYIVQCSSGDGTLNNITQVYPVSKTTSTLTVGAREYSGTRIATGATFRASWHVVGYND